MTSSTLGFRGIWGIPGLDLGDPGGGIWGEIWGFQGWIWGPHLVVGRGDPIEHLEPLQGRLAPLGFVGQHPWI